MKRERLAVGRWLVGICLLCAAWTSEARPLERHCSPGYAAVQLELPPQLRPADAEQVATQLRAELLAGGIDVCAEAASPVAVVRIATDGELGHATVEIQDRVTKKDIRRSLRLDDTARDSRPLLVAVTADELLRASWVEINLRRVATTPGAVPAAVPVAVTQAVEKRLGSESSSLRLRHAGAAMSTELFGGGQWHVGPDLRFQSARWAERLRLSLRAGARWSPSVRAPDGSVQTFGIGGGVGLSWRLTADDRPREISLFTRADLTWLRFHADPQPDAVGWDQSGVALTTLLGATAWWSLGGDWRVLTELAGGYVPMGVETRDRKQTVNGVTGAAGVVALGLVRAW